MKFHINMKKKEFFSLEIFKDPPGHFPVQSTVEILLQQGFGPGDLQRSLPTDRILQFCEIKDRLENFLLITLCCMYMVKYKKSQ